MLWLIFLTAAILLAVIFFIYGNDHYWPSRGVPFVRGSEIGSFLDRILIRIPFHEQTTRIYVSLKAKQARIGGIMEFRRPVAVVLDLDLIKHVTVKDFDHFINRRPFGPAEDHTMGKVLFNLDSQEWKDTRSAISPTFTTGKIRNMFAIFTESAERMVGFLKRELESSPAGALDLRDACSRFTMDMIASSAFGLESHVFTNKDSLFAVMMNRFQRQFNGYAVYKLFMSILLPGLFKNLGLQMMDDSAHKFFSDVIRKTLAHRAHAGERRADFLQLLIDARDGQLKQEGADDVDEEEDKNMNSVKGLKKASAVDWTEDTITHQSLVFFLGADATETLLIYGLYELALNPDIQDKLATEVDAIAASDKLSSYNAVNQNEYLDMFVSETMRKYTPAARIERKCTHEYKVPGSSLVIPVGQILMIPVYAIHHDPEYFPDPFKFNPDRFTAAEKKKRNPYAYMPFGVGPRNCIAQRFAIIEGKCALAHLVHAFRVEPCAQTSIPMKYDTSGAMKPLNGMWLKLTPRK